VAPNTSLQTDGRVGRPSRSLSRPPLNGRSLGSAGASPPGQASFETLMISCTVLYSLFLGAVLCAILGNLAGVVAWQRRREGLGTWEWVTNPLALFRSSNFAEPRAPARMIALGLLLLGVIALGSLAVILIKLQRGGAVSVCGFRF